MSRLVLNPRGPFALASAGMHFRSIAPQELPNLHTAHCLELTPRPSCPKILTTYAHPRKPEIQIGPW